jgi:hypothetical protein
MNCVVNQEPCRGASLSGAGVVLLACLLLGPSGPATAADIHVPGDQPTIQAAITAAVDGDTILVDADTYVENITVNKRLTLRGAGGGSNTIHVWHRRPRRWMLRPARRPEREAPASAVFGPFTGVCRRRASRRSRGPPTRKPVQYRP